MSFSENFLFFLAKWLYRGEVGHSKEMKKALSDRQEYNKYRGGQIDKILAAAKKYGLDIVGKTVLDMGCNDGAITGGYLERGAARAFGVDIDEAAIELAQKNRSSNRLTFLHSTTSALPIADSAVDLIICYDVFEHVSTPGTMLEECYRVLRPGGRMLIGTWGWYHPFAPHLWSTMPVPWAHVFFSEKTLLRTCRRVYDSPWYIPNMHDLDETGRKIEGKFCQDSIDEEYLNKFLIKDFVEVFERSKFTFQVHPQHFGSKYARWTRFFLKTPYVREFVTSYIWVVLSKEMTEHHTRTV